MAADPNDVQKKREAFSIWSIFRRKRGPAPQVVLYKTRNCCLCVTALDVVNGVRKRTPFDLEIVDITDDAERLNLYGNEVPVVFVNGRKRFFGKVDPVLFRREVERPPATG